MDDPRTRQSAFNAASADQWAGFADHRARVSALLGAGGPPRPSRLCVLGAGNANDLELAALLAVHREVHLVDLDREALARGVARQAVVSHPGLRLHGGIDLTGMLGVIKHWSPNTPIGPGDLVSLATQPASWVASGLPAPFDIVGSTCVLSQLVGNAAPALGRAHSRFRAVVDAIRVGHLRLLNKLTAPGGTVVLITDVVSSETFPELVSLPDRALASQLPRLAREGNFITGVHPDSILAGVDAEPEIAARVARRDIAAPWRWRLHQRVYLVWAVGLVMHDQSLYRG